MISDYLRLKKEEKKRISELSNEVNKQRIDLKIGVIIESEVLHELIDEAFKKAEVIKGKITIK